MSRHLVALFIIPSFLVSVYGADPLPASTPSQSPTTSGADQLAAAASGLSMSKGSSFNMGGLGLPPQLYPGLSPFAPVPAAVAVPAPPIGLATSFGGPIGTGYISQTPLGAMKGVIGDLFIPGAVLAVVLLLICGFIWLMGLLFGLVDSDKWANKFNPTTTTTTRPYIDRVTEQVYSAINKYDNSYDTPYSPPVYSSNSNKDSIH